MCVSSVKSFTLITSTNLSNCFISCDDFASVQYVTSVILDIESSEVEAHAKAMNIITPCRE